jgi:hypothetical protein
MHDLRTLLAVLGGDDGEGTGLTEGNLEVAEKARETAYHQ